MMNFMFLSPNVNNVVDYFKKSFGGSIDIDYKYESLELNLEQLMNNNIRVDKLIIVFYDNGGFNIKREISCLGNLMENNAFFKVNEILVFSENTEYCNSGISAFKFIMQNVGFKNYTVKVYDNGISIPKIYKDVMGIVSDDVTRTSYNIVYRSEKGSESKVGYSPRKREKSLEPVRRDGVKEYERFKDNSRKTESGRLIVEPSPKEIEEININLDVFKSNIDSIKNIVIFTGPAKSGSSALLSNALFETSKGLAVDLSRTLGSKRILHYLSSDNTLSYPSIEFIDNRDLLLGETYNSGSLKCCSCDKYDLKMDYLKYVLSIPNIISSNEILIDCDLESLEDIVNLVGERLKKIVFTCESAKEEFEFIKPIINRFSKFERYVFLNEHLELREGYNPISALIANKEVDDCKIIRGERLFNKEISLDIFI